MLVAQLELQAKIAAHNFLTCISTTNANESSDQEYILFCGTRYLEKDQQEIERQKSSSIQSIRYYIVIFQLLRLLA